MSWELLVQVLFNGLSMGMIYVLIASGFTLIYSIMRILNFAHGELYMIAGFITFYLFEEAGLNYFVTLLLAMAVVALLGAFIERVFFHPFLDQHDPPLIIALGLMMLIPGVALVGFGELDRGVKKIFPGVLQVGGAFISFERIGIIIIAIIIMIALNFFLKNFKLGRALQAISQDAEAAALQGVNVGAMSTFGFALSCALAAAAGVLIAPLFVLNPFIGVEATFKALIVVVIGGLGSVQGAVAGGLLLGFMESFGYTLIGGVSEILIFCLVLFILLVRPRGLMGRY